MGFLPFPYAERSAAFLVPLYNDAPSLFKSFFCFFSICSEMICVFSRFLAMLPPFSAVLARILKKFGF